jgi:hypothetical protein
MSIKLLELSQNDQLVSLSNAEQVMLSGGKTNDEIIAEYLYSASLSAYANPGTSQSDTSIESQGDIVTFRTGDANGGFLRSFSVKGSQVQLVEQRKF